MIQPTLLFCMFFLPAPTLAEAQFKLITTKQLKNKLDKGEDLLLIDALPGPRHRMGHIPGSINIPFGRFAEMNDQLPEDKAKALIFYCLGPKCVLSKRSAKAALKLGHSNVYVYNEGIPGWSRAGHPLQKDLELEKVKLDFITSEALLGDPSSYYVIDVMYKDGFDKGHVKGAVNINLDDLEARIPSLPKDKTIVLTDHTNKLAKIAGWLLHHHGVTQVKILKGGKLGLRKKGVKLEVN